MDKRVLATDAVYNGLLRKVYKSIRAYEEDCEAELTSPHPDVERQHNMALASLQRERSFHNKITRLDAYGLTVRCDESIDDFYRRVAETYGLEDEEEARAYVAYMSR